MNNLRTTLKGIEGKKITIQCVWCGNVICRVGGKPDVKGQHTKECKYTEEENYEQS